MKPRIGVYLSEQMAARLAAAAKRPGATKSALVEAALDRFLGADDDIGAETLARQLSALNRQLRQLDRGLRIVNETVVHHARFHLAVTPLLPAAAQRAACALGAERFEEFVTQVQRRVHVGTSLMAETMDRVGAKPLPDGALNPAEDRPIKTESADFQAGSYPSTAEDDVPGRLAAVREGGSKEGFPEWAGNPFN